MIIEYNDTPYEIQGCVIMGPAMLPAGEMQDSGFRRDFLGPPTDQRNSEATLIAEMDGRFGHG